MFRLDIFFIIPSFIVFILRIKVTEAITLEHTVLLFGDDLVKIVVNCFQRTQNVLHWSYNMVNY